MLHAASIMAAEHITSANVVFSSLLGVINLRRLGAEAIFLVRCGKCISISQSPYIILYTLEKMKLDC